MGRLLRSIIDAFLMIALVFALIVGVVFAYLMRVTPLREKDYIQVRQGKATWYTAAGMECACRYYPIGSYVLVRRGSIELRLKVTSRGPAWWVMRDRKVIIDLTRTAFLWFEPKLATGHIDVTVQACPAPYL